MRCNVGIPVGIYSQANGISAAWAMPNNRRVNQSSSCGIEFR